MMHGDENIFIHTMILLTVFGLRGNGNTDDLNSSAVQDAVDPEVMTRFWPLTISMLYCPCLPHPSYCWSYCISAYQISQTSATLHKASSDAALILSSTYIYHYGWLQITRSTVNSSSNLKGKPCPKFFELICGNIRYCNVVLRAKMQLKSWLICRSFLTLSDYFTYFIAQNLSYIALCI